MRQKRMTLYLLFWLLHKRFFQSSMTEVRHRVQTATDSAFTACWIQFALSREHSMYWQSKTKRNTILCSLHRQWVHGRRCSVSVCHSESYLAVPKDCRQTHKVLGLHCFSSSFVYEKHCVKGLLRREQEIIFIMIIVIILHNCTEDKT